MRTQHTLSSADVIWMRRAALPGAGWLVTLAAVCLLLARPASAEPHPPAWVTTLESVPTPKLPNDPALVELYSEVSLSVDASGRETSLHR